MAKTPRRKTPRKDAASPAGANPASAPERAEAANRFAGGQPAADLARRQSAASGPTYEEIAARAHDRYRRRGHQDGLDLEDWLEAERELKQERGLK